MEEVFKDHFSQHAPLYARYRPRYPAALFQWLCNVAPGTELAWDAGTGNGQVAHGLVTRFARVLATDASVEQVANAEPHARIQYAVATYDSGLPAASVSLITVGQAIHWFDMPRFNAEVRRVLRPEGVLAVFAYAHHRVSPDVDPYVRHHHDVTLGPYWPPEHLLIYDGYRTIDLPIAELDAPPFEMREAWSVEHLIGFLRTWSATQRFIARNGEAPILDFEAGLRERWGSAPVRDVVWPMVVRAGRLAPPPAP